MDITWLIPDYGDCDDFDPCAVQCEVWQQLTAIQQDAVIVLTRYWRIAQYEMIF